MRKNHLPGSIGIVLLVSLLLSGCRKDDRASRWDVDVLAPLVTGRMLVAAAIHPGQRVLLVGSATGYTAAVLARLGAEVHAVEEQAELMAMAQAATADADIHWVAGPLNAGAPHAAPFDRIIVEGAIDTLPETLSAQLVDGGRLVAARPDGAVTRLIHGVKTGGTIALRSFADMDVAPLPGFAAPAGFTF